KAFIEAAAARISGSVRSLLTSSA
ncbi:hypothetical protein AE02_03247, partial [Klebsiella variicola]